MKCNWGRPNGAVALTEHDARLPVALLSVWEHSTVVLQHRGAWVRPKASLMSAEMPGPSGAPGALLRSRGLAALVPPCGGVHDRRSTDLSRERHTGDHLTGSGMSGLGVRFAPAVALD